MRQIAESILNIFQNSGKKHLLVTGSKGSGKTTFVNELEMHFSNGNKLPGIVTYLVSNSCVMLREKRTDKKVCIGEMKHTMIPVEEGFLTLGVDALERAKLQNEEWILIDELGFLESNNEEFKKAVREVFSEKRVLAVVRKQELPFLNELREREDVMVVDMDDYHRKIGCVIMASGLGIRFGSNKLMADFKGKPLVQHILDTTQDVFEKRVVVTRSKEVEALCKEQNIDVIFHTYPNRNDTVRLGTTHMSDMDACVFCPSDQPLLGKRTLQKMRNAFSFENLQIIRLAFGETPGTPILFANKYFEELKMLPEKKGGGYIVRKYPDEVSLVFAQSAKELYDIDTKEDLTKLEEMNADD